MSEVTKKSTDPRPAERAPVPPSIVRKAVVASAMGNAMEWLDYGAFTPGTITGVIGRVFFPREDRRRGRGGVAGRLNYHPPL
ncbi:hypothetical protein KGQ20_45370 [Catenulispora sp. NF23]|uniref:hypothetical protein n=1 Tax=Catenulispora pinistramenti TaxID=2705254 RepID=UPI001BABD5D2|nr:hypothetical protein [Catenulispora pinistramenti]MBS2539997.1 hypothetical protein [Catenulispora pinistramenti]